MIIIFDLSFKGRHFCPMQLTVGDNQATMQYNKEILSIIINVWHIKNAHNIHGKSVVLVGNGSKLISFLQVHFSVHVFQMEPSLYLGDFWEFY